MFLISVEHQLLYLNPLLWFAPLPINFRTAHAQHHSPAIVLNVET